MGVAELEIGEAFFHPGSTEPRFFRDVDGEAVGSAFVDVALRPTTANVDLGALARNVAAIRAHVGPSVKIMGIVKANAYGHGLVRTSQALLDAGIDELGVAFLEEGITLREAGVRAKILVLGGLIGNQITHFLDHDLAITASSPFKLQQIEEVAALRKRRARVHLKVDTGLERIGIHWDTSDKLFEASLAAKHCDIEGVFSHLASSDSADPTYTKLQLERFEEATSFWERRSLPTPPRHIANSGAVLQHDASWFDMVRPGIMLYGVYPSASVERTVELEPVLSLTTRVVYFKVVRAGSPVSYDSTWAPDDDTRLVTLPVGYGDGYPRRLSGHASVLIHGDRFPVVGRITMDAMMVDIGQGSAFNGDPVVLLGRQGDDVLTVEQLAEWGETIPYEVLTSINTRVPRYYSEP